MWGTSKGLSTSGGLTVKLPFDPGRSAVRYGSLLRSDLRVGQMCRRVGSLWAYPRPRVGRLCHRAASRPWCAGGGRRRTYWVRLQRVRPCRVPWRRPRVGQMWYLFDKSVCEAPWRMLIGPSSPRGVPSRPPHSDRCPVRPVKGSRCWNHHRVGRM